MKLYFTLLLLFINSMHIFSQDKLFIDQKLEKQYDSILTLATRDSKQGLEAAEKFTLLCKKEKKPWHEVEGMAIKNYVYENTCDYKKLLNSTEQTIIIAEKYHFYTKSFYASVQKANALIRLGLFPEAKKLLDDNQFVINKLDQKTEEGLVIISYYWTVYSIYYNFQEKYTDCIKMLNEALFYYQKIKSNRARINQLVTCYTNIGSAYIAQKKVDSAFIFYDKAQNLFLPTKSHNLVCEVAVYSGYGQGYNIKKEYKKAIPYLIKSLELSKREDYKDMHLDALLQLSESYKHVDKKNNTYYYRQFLKAQKEYEKNTKLESKEIARIKNQNSSFYDRNKHSVWSVSGFLLIGFLGITFYQSKKRKKIEEEKIEISEVVKEQSEEISTLKIKVNDAFEEVLELAKRNDPTFVKRFSEVYPEFFAKLASEFEGLTNTQLKVLAFSFLNFNTKDIATIMNTSVRTTQTHKYRIRKIINIDSEKDLINWTQKF